MFRANRQTAPGAISSKSSRVSSSRTGPAIPTQNNCPTFCRSGRNCSDSVIKLSQKGRNPILPVTPVLLKLVAMSDDFYCDKVLSGRIEVNRVYETENVLAYHHTRPFWKTHIVVIPKRHISSLLALGREDDQLLAELFEVIRKV